MREDLYMPAELLTVEAVADYLGVHAETVRRWIRSGRLPALMGDPGIGYRVDRAELARFMARSSRQPVAAPA